MTRPPTSVPATASASAAAVADDASAVAAIALDSSAAKAIGQRATNDYDHSGGLDIAHHIAQFADGAAAAPLAHLLRNDEAIKNSVASFNTNNLQAIERQARFKRWRNISIYAAFVATIIGALYLFPFDDWLASLGWPPVINQQPVKGVLFAAEIIALLVMFGASHWLHSRDLHISFMQTRSNAEVDRLALFANILAAPAPADAQSRFPDGASLLPLKLEYFRRFLFQDQYAWYQKRADQHRETAVKAKGQRKSANYVYGCALFAAVSAAILVGLQASSPGIEPIALLIQRLSQDGWLEVATTDALTGYWQGALAWLYNTADQVLLGIGVVVSAIHSLTTSRTRLEMADRNTARYLSVAKFLAEEGRETFLAARADAASGNSGGVTAHVDKIVSELKQEHDDWCALCAMLAGEER